MKRVGVVFAIVLAAIGTSHAQELSKVVLEELRQQLLRRMTGTVEGRVYFEAPRPGARDEPLVGVGVFVVPRSSGLLERLETAKRESRESLRGFREAAPTVYDAVDDYETVLWRAGYPDAAVHSSTDASGAFRVQVPAGAWLLIVRRSVFVTIHSSRSAGVPTASALDPLARYATSQYQHFLPVARLTGFDAVSVWLRELEVEAGQTVALDLHDRGVWLSGVIEEHETSRRVRSTGRGSRR